MNILLIGHGGREHAFAYKLSQSALCHSLFIAPGNAGTAGCGTNLDIAVTDFDALAAAVEQHQINMVIVGPEEPLCRGIKDDFAKRGLTKNLLFIGPDAHAAQLEGSKAFAKDFMRRHGVPTAVYREFSESNYLEGLEYLRTHTLPIVLKADGLAAGKGVLICESHLEALAEFELMIMRSKFGEAGKKVVVEQFLKGIEVSCFALTDGKNYLILPEAKDYKRIGEGDKGLNTGGMGAVSPVPMMSPALKKKIEEKIIAPTIKGIHLDKMDYCGFVFIGLMIDNEEPYVVEYNCRMGDPETEVVLPRIKNDLVALMEAMASDKLRDQSIDEDNRTAVAIVAVSGGYPGEFEKGKRITGAGEAVTPDSMMFHAGTKLEDGNAVTNGGRVLASVSFGDNVQSAAERSEKLLQKVSFEDMYYRKDIGYEFRN